MRIARIDHLVLTVADLSRTVAWYTRVLGMRHEEFGDHRHALVFGNQKLNLHEVGRELHPRAAAPQPGSVDICLVSAVALPELRRSLEDAGVAIELGPVPRTGAIGAITSVYLRDPDENLVEIAVYDTGHPQVPAAGDR